MTLDNEKENENKEDTESRNGERKEIEPLKLCIPLWNFNQGQMFQLFASVQKALWGVAVIPKWHKKATLH